MGLAAEAYARMLTALLPPGKLWRLVLEGLLPGLPELLLGCADELARIDERADDLVRESNPSTAVEMLPELEADLGIAAATMGTTQRQAAVIARLIARQRYRPADFQLALAPLLAQLPAAVVVLERSRAFCIAVGDDREIFRFFIYRDPTIAGTYFLSSAQTLVDQIKPSHTAGYVIESVSFLSDDPHSLCDRDLLGA